MHVEAQVAACAASSFCACDVPIARDCVGDPGSRDHRQRRHGAADGSGLGARGWPGCTPGAVFLEKDYYLFVEFGNRVVSLLPILLSLGTAVASHFLRELPRRVRACAGSRRSGRSRRHRSGC